MEDRPQSWEDDRQPRSISLRGCSSILSRMTLLMLLDLLLVLGFTLRLTRLVTTDEWGVMFIRGPIAKRLFTRGMPQETRDRRAQWYDGLTCPFCVGFWLGALVLLSLWVAGGPGALDGTLIEVWRWVAGAFALNYLVGHISGRAD